MPIGPGKYDDLCTIVRKAASASAAVVIVFDGVRGSGFSMQASPEAVPVIARILSDVVRQIESESEEIGNGRSEH